MNTPHEVILDRFDNEIKDGDSNAIFSYEYGEHFGEIFKGRSDNYYEVYPHDGKDEPVIFEKGDNAVTESDFVMNAVLQVHGK